METYIELWKRLIKACIKKNWSGADMMLATENDTRQWALERIEDIKSYLANPPLPLTRNDINYYSGQLKVFREIANIKTINKKGVKKE